MHTPTLFLRSVLALTLSLSLFACGGDDDDDDDDDGLQSVVLNDDGVVAVELLSADGPLAVGRNVVYYEVTMLADGATVTDATVTHGPVMQMREFQHACPETDPGAAGSDGLYQGTIIFTMGSSDEGSWSNTVTVVLNGETTEHTIVFDDLTVASNSRRQTLSWDDNGTEVVGFLTLNPGAPWQAGSNPHILTAHYREDMMSFPALDDLSIDLSLALGDGAATEASAPSYDKNGEYVGALDFSEAGSWTVTATVTRASVELGSVSWTVDVQ